MITNRIGGVKKKKANGGANKAGRNGQFPAVKVVAAPVATSRRTKNVQPRFTSLRNGDIVVTHRELWNDVLGSTTTFNLAISRSIYPANMTWLQGLASRYESYVFEKLTISYETMSTTGGTGYVVMAVDFDNADIAPASKAQIMSYRHSERGAPWDSFKIVCDPMDLRKRTTYFNGAVPANDNAQFYYVGALYVAVGSQASSVVNIGEVWLEYTVRLMTPSIGKISVGESLYAKYTGTSNAAPFATKEFGNLPATVASTATTTSVSTWTFTAPWSGVIVLNLAGTGITSVASSGSGNEAEQWELENAGATVATYLSQVDILEPGLTFVLTIGNTTLTATDCRFYQGGLE